MKRTFRILIVDDDPDVLTAARVALRHVADSISTESNHLRLRTLLEREAFDLILLDMNFAAGVSSGNEGLFLFHEIKKRNPSQAVIFITAYGDIKLAVEAMKAGAKDFVVKPWTNEVLQKTVSDALQNKSGRGEIAVKHRPVIVGESDAIKKVILMAEKVAPTDANILLLGENGTGKEVLAKYIHGNSARRNSPFIKVDVGALSATLFESELFGLKKGAFTDAKEDRKGRFELADSGTLFLDEIGNMPAALQIKLLSALQNREVIPVGGNVPVPVNVRLITATNLDIQSAVRNSDFREDLLYRINTVQIVVPPLRHRLDDIPLLASHFLEMYCTRYGKEIKHLSHDAIQLLQHHSWPGNVRELQHAIERAVIMSNNSTLKREDFLLKSTRSSLNDQQILTIDDMERNAIVAAIDKHQGNLTKVSKELGLGRTTLYRKMEKYGIQK